MHQTNTLCSHDLLKMWGLPQYLDVVLPLRAYQIGLGKKKKHGYNVPLTSNDSQQKMC